jgi:hypothetical protein
MRVTAIVSTVVLSAGLSAGLLAGCGSSDDKAGADKSTGDKGSSAGDYCAQLKDAKADFDTLDSDSPDFSKFDDAIARFHELADAAPSEVADDWKTLDGALTTMEKALSDAGLKIEDLGAITAGNLPEGMTAEDLQAIGPKLQTAFSGLETDEVEKAGDAIEKHAKSECGVDLSK